MNTLIGILVAVSLLAALVISVLAIAFQTAPDPQHFGRATLVFFSRLLRSPKTIVVAGTLLVALSAQAAEPGAAVAAAGLDLAQLNAIALTVMGVLTFVAGIAHSFGAARVASNALRADAAKHPGTGLSSLELALAAHVDAGDDEALLAAAKSSLAGKSVKPIVDAATKIANGGK